MKQIIYIALFTLIFTACNSTQNEEKQVINKTETSIKDGLATSSFHVWGNCGMCKKTIEGSLKVAGVKSANWNVDTKKMTVVYDTALIQLPAIQADIAAVGYDNSAVKGNDKAYSQLHECCQYERK